MPTTVRDAARHDRQAIIALYREVVRHGAAGDARQASGQAETQRRPAALVQARHPHGASTAERERAGDVRSSSNVRARSPERRTRTCAAAGVVPCRGVGLDLRAPSITPHTLRGLCQMIAVRADARHPALIRPLPAPGFTLGGRAPGTGYKHGRRQDALQWQRAPAPASTTAPNED